MVNHEEIEKLISVLEKKYLIRGEWRSGAKWYELTHDRLIGPIKASNSKWMDSERSRRTKRNRQIAVPSVAIGLALILAYLVIVLNPVEEPELALGQIPSYLSLNPNTNTLYVSNYGNDSISVVDGKTNKVRDNIPLGIQPSFISVNPSTDMIYVASPANDSITVINGKTKEISNRIEVSDAYDISIDPENNTIYVAGYNYSKYSGAVYAIDGKTNQIKEEIALSDPPSAISINPKTNMLYVAASNQSSGSSYIAVVDVRDHRVASQIAIPGDPSSMFINEDQNIVYIGGGYSSSLQVIDGKTNQIKEEIALSGPPSAISFNPKKEILYAATSDSVTVINGSETYNTAMLDLAVDKNLFDVSFNPAANKIYVSDLDSNALHFLDVGEGGSEISKEGTIPGVKPPTSKVIQDPSSMIFNEKTGMIYVASEVSNSISVIDGETGQEINRTKVKKPTQMALDTNKNLLYTTSAGLQDTGATFNTSRPLLSFESGPMESSGHVTMINGTNNAPMEDNTADEMEISIDPLASTLSTNSNESLIYLAGQSPFLYYNWIYALDGKSMEKIAQTSLEQPPMHVAHNQRTGLTYVAAHDLNSDLSHVYVLETKSLTLKYEIPIEDRYPYYIFTNPTSNKIYVLASSDPSDRSENYLYLIDGRRHSVSEILPTDKPFDVKVDPGINKIYILSESYDENLKKWYPYISVIDGETNQELKNINLNHVGSAEYLSVDSSNSTIYVMSHSSDSITLISGKTNEVVGNWRQSSRQG
jgi:YVTN family beta-propeller protein